MKKTILLLLFCVSSVWATDPPALFFTDLQSGPATGNSDTTNVTGGGVYVNVYGNFFGSQAASTITMNGAACLQVVSWATTWRWYQKITVQLTSSCTTGNIVVTTSAGTSNALPFTVRSGSIYYVATTGSDSNAGTFASPWLTIPHAVQTAGAVAGNTVYLRSGVTQTADDGQGWSAAIVLADQWCKGTASSPDFLAAYPGVTNNQIGPTSATSPSFGMRGKDMTASPQACLGNWGFSGINFRGVTAILVAGGPALSGAESTGWRFIGNDLSNAQNPGGGGGGGGFEFTSAGGKILGNYMHDLNTVASDNLAQGLYLSTDASHTEVGWNELFPNSTSHGRTALQVHSSPLSYPSSGADQTGYILYDISIHDNQIHDVPQEAILVDTATADQGPILVYNNVVWDTNQNGVASHAVRLQLSGDFQLCFSAGGGSAGGPCDIGNSGPSMQFFNNTIYCNTSTAGNACMGSFFPDVHSGTGFPPSTNVRATQNLLYSTGTAAYWQPGLYNGASCGNTDSQATCLSWTGDNNLIFGNGGGTFTNFITNSTNSDPLFVNASTRDFHLQPGSPALGKGAAIAAATTVTGVQVTNQGAGCTSAPTITPTGGGGGTITFTARVTGGAANKLQAVTFSSTGGGGLSGYSSGYSSAPTLAFSGGGCASTPAAVATVATLPGLTYDIDGRIRPSSPSLGAYDIPSGSTPIALPPLTRGFLLRF